MSSKAIMRLTLMLLGIVFVTLKLCHVIGWSWWWVTAPLWAGFGLLVAIVLLAGLVTLIAAVMA